jgi:hypothetical protein
VPVAIREQKVAFKKEQMKDAFAWDFQMEALSRVKQDLFWKGYALDVPVCV